MISQGKIKGLNKLVNSGIIKNIYPMIDHIDIDIYHTHSYHSEDFLALNCQIYLNDPEITKENMYEMGFDPHYLVEFHISDLLPYFGLKNVINTKIEVYSPDGSRIMYYIL